MTPNKIDYQKRKNKELFKQLESNAFIGLSNAQNYIPVYNRYFDLNETNYNNINLNHTWCLSKIDASVNNTKCFKCVLSNVEGKDKTKNVFFKMAPLLDPYKYMSGKYELSDKLLSMPTLTPCPEIHPKIMDYNNSSYVDGFFYYLSNRLLEQGFIHGMEYYGSFLGIKNNFTCNIIDDIEYLATSEFFNKNKGILFDTADYSNLLHDENESVKKRQNPLLISDESIVLDIEELLEEIPNNISNKLTTDLEEVIISASSSKKAHSLKSDSSCSSRTSHTNSKDSVIDQEESEWESVDDNEDNSADADENSANYEDISDSSSQSFLEDDEELTATIPRFPVQMIAIEYCNNTFDSLIRTNKLTNEEWFSALMQIVMILLAYQKTYSMTHNDLHTNNVMFIPTDKKYLYYQYNGTCYKVPTFGKIFKIIDFGRAIYKFNNALFCSDSFQVGGDASTQYNTEPFMNDRKPRLDPNQSFDLCRLACSIFDYLIRDMREVDEKCEKDELINIIVEWCLDDNGINVLYKKSGAERYPDFKLYKMIARNVHKHTPQAQLARKQFSKFATTNVKKGEYIMNIDELN